MVTHLLADGGKQNYGSRTYADAARQVTFAGGRVPRRAIRVTCSLPSHTGMDIRTFTHRASSEDSQQGIIDRRPIIALGWGFETTVQTRGCGKGERLSRHVCGILDRDPYSLFLVSLLQHCVG